MFRLSQKADYGLILLSHFAKASVFAEATTDGSRDKSSVVKFHSRSEAKAVLGSHSGSVAKEPFVSISIIAKKNQISAKFLSQVASELKNAGILASREGKSGGYTLAKSPDEIKLLDVLKVLDGELVEGKCFEDDHECVCGAGDIWQEMKTQMEQTIGKKTVADLVVR